MRTIWLFLEALVFVTPPALLDSPGDAWCVKTRGAPTTLEEAKSPSKAAWRPPGLDARHSLSIQWT